MGKTAVRKEPGLKLERSPLVLVLVQVRFPAYLKMAQHMPEIQESLRAAGFSRYVEEQTQQVIFGPEIQTGRGSRWVCASRDRREAAILTSNFVVYETSRYDVFETFLDRFRQIVDVVKDQAGIEFSEQVGLRYVDLIRKAGDLEASHFFRESLRGLTSEDLGASKSRQQFVIQGKTPHGDLKVQSFENSGGNFMPPDLVSTHLEFDVDLPKDEVFRVLDCDHIFRGEVDFDSDSLVQKLWGLHEFMTKAFRGAVTPDAIEYWKAGDGK